MIRIAGIGDNTVDVYTHSGLMFPGGNAVNVPVLARRLGHQASYIGRLGKDAAGKLILESLLSEGVDVSHIRIMEGPNAWSTIDLVDGDRVFVDNDKGVSIGWGPSQNDLEFLSTHDLVHSSIYSHLEPSLEAIRGASKAFSFDFSSVWSPVYLEQVVPYVHLAFLSAPDQSTQACVDLLRQVVRLGAKCAVVTRGEEGSLAYDGHKVLQQGIVETQVVDTLGAGDAFIAAFLCTYLEGDDLEAALKDGASNAARNCAVYGAFGYGVPYTGVLEFGRSKR